MNPSPSGSDIKQFLRLLGEGERIFRMLHLEDLDGVNLNLRECDLQGSRLKEARLGHANLSNSLVNGCCFQQALLWGADLSRIKAINTFWQEADLSGSRMQGADFRGSLMHRCCFRGVVAANSKWHESRLVEADFRSGLDQLTDLGESDFENADLSFALLQGANLHGANLRGCCLYGADFSKADLREADLSGCDLRETKLEQAQLTGTIFEGAIFPEDFMPSSS